VVQPYCLLYGTTGQAWFDDLYVTIPPGVLNPGMEAGTTVPDFWSTYNNDLTRETGWIPGAAHMGNRSIKIVNSTGASAGWNGETVTFAAPYPQTLTFGGWSKAQSVGTGGLYALDFYVEYEDGSYEWIYNNLTFGPGTHDWEKRESTVTFARGVKEVQPYCLLYGITGQAWFDDLYVTIAPGVLNPSMEAGTTAPDFWSTYNNELTRETGWIPGVAHTGNRSIKIVNSTGASAGWNGETVTFAAPYPKTLTFGGWSKAQSVGTGGLYGLDFYVEYEDGSFEWIYNNLTFGPGTHDWEKRESTVAFAKGVKVVQPYLLLYWTSGSAWFDVISVIIK